MNIIEVQYQLSENDLIIEEFLQGIDYEFFIDNDGAECLLFKGIKYSEIHDYKNSFRLFLLEYGLVEDKDYTIEVTNYNMPKSFLNASAHRNIVIVFINPESYVMLKMSHG